MNPPINEMASKINAGTPCITKLYDQKHGTYTDNAPALKAAPAKCYCGTSLSMRKR